MVKREKKPCVIVKKDFAEKTLNILKKVGIYDSNFKISREEIFVKIPLKRKMNMEIRESLVRGNVTFKEDEDIFEKINMVRSYKDLIKHRIPRNLICRLPTSYDIVGNVILIRIPYELKEYEKIIGEALLKFHKKAKAVYTIVGGTLGRTRITPLRLIAGKNIEKTVYVEHGCKIVVFPGKTYINPSLSFEHKRVSEQISDGDRVLDMFSGVGGFSILIASTKKAKVYAVDINPYAIKSMLLSIPLNRFRGELFPILGDVAEVVKGKLENSFDHIIMNLPEKSHEFLKYACKALSETGGVIHYYRFAEVSRDPIVELLKIICKYRNVVKILTFRKVLEASPRRKLYVIDVYVR